MLTAELKSEIKLQINQCLYDSHLITSEVYEEAKSRIITEAKRPKTEQKFSLKPEV